MFSRQPYSLDSYYSQSKQSVYQLCKKPCKFQYLKVCRYYGPGLAICFVVVLNPNLPLFPPFCQIWSPPSYATAHICHGLSTGTMETRHLSARTKLKCNSHFTLNVIIMRHSVMFLQKLLLFCYFLCLFANQSLFFYFNFLS